MRSGRRVVCRLSRDGITQISDYGMLDFFGDALKATPEVIGAYDPTMSSGEIYSNNSSILLNTGVGVLLKHLSRGVNLSGIDIFKLQNS